jgi:hypothetical protein
MDSKNTRLAVVVVVAVDGRSAPPGAVGRWWWQEIPKECCQTGTLPTAMTTRRWSIKDGISSDPFALLQASLGAVIILLIAALLCIYHCHSLLYPQGGYDVQSAFLVEAMFADGVLHVTLSPMRWILVASA